MNMNANQLSVERKKNIKNIIIKIDQFLINLSMKNAFNTYVCIYYHTSWWIMKRLNNSLKLSLAANLKPRCKQEEK